MKDLGPKHWENLYLEGRVPWDAGGVPVDLEKYLVKKSTPGRALVPGCGSGYEIVSLVSAGHDVLAIDFSPAAIDIARKVTRGSVAQLEVSDFFTLDSGLFDLVYERAFMCALPLSQRANWSRKIASLIRPGGVLVGYFFLDGDELDGPPFGIHPEDLDMLLGKSFSLLDSHQTKNAKPVFHDQEYWQVWSRSGAQTD
jgi:SAM-dependent methyltransferase